jgi:uncharacterized protein involved in exopolysaccharide biosynthesis
VNEGIEHRSGVAYTGEQSTTPKRSPEPATRPETSLVTLGILLLRHRRRILGLILVGAAVGLSTGLLKTREYASHVVFIPREAEASTTSGLALAASQFGIQVPSGNGGWGPPVYVELLRSRGVLESLVLDTLSVSELGGRRVAVMDLLEVKPTTPPLRLERAVQRLRTRLSVDEDRKLGAVRLTVTTQWPSVSLALAQRMVSAESRFNLEVRRSQVKAERAFVEKQASDAERELREAEDRYQEFLERNRGSSILSPMLRFESDRLQRDVGFKQQLTASLFQQREDARVREVRDTPVITILEGPWLPVEPEARRTLQRTVLGAFLGALIGLVATLVAYTWSAAQQQPTEERTEFFRLLAEVTPRFLRRKTTGKATLTAK